MRRVPADIARTWYKFARKYRAQHDANVERRVVQSAHNIPLHLMDGQQVAWCLWAIAQAEVEWGIVGAAA